MKKTTIKKMLAVVVGVLIIAASLTAGFSASAETYPAYYGNDAGNGFNSYTSTATGTSSWPFNLKPADDIYNLDFQNDFWFWSGHDCSDGLGSIGGRRANRPFDLITDGDNKYAQMKTPYYCDILTALFTAKNVAAGDELVVIYDAKGADATKIRPFVRQIPIKTGITYDETTGENNSTTKEASPKDAVVNLTTYDEANPTEFAVQTTAAGWKTYILGNVAAVKNFSTEDATLLSDIYLQVKVDAPGLEHKVTEVDAAVDNIRIAKVKNGVYTDIATNEVIYTDPNASGGQGGATGPNYPAYYGTADNGFHSHLSHYPLYLKPADDIYNLDFSDGFCCWAGKAIPADQGDGSYASDAFDLVTEGDNKYAKVKAEGYVSNMCTALFTAKNVQAGDSLVVLYDVKGEDGYKLRIKLVQEFLKEKAVYDTTTGLNTTLKADGVTLLNPSPGVPAVMVGTSMESSEFSVQTEAEGWTTLIAETNQAVLDPKSSPAQAATGDTLRDDIYLQVVVTCPSDAGVAVGDKVDAAIDNIRIAKVVDGQYIDIATNEVIDAGSNGNGGTGNEGTGNEGTGNEGNGGNGSATTGDSVLALAALFFISGAAVFGTAKAMKNR